MVRVSQIIYLISGVNEIIGFSVEVTAGDGVVPDFIIFRGVSNIRNTY